MTVQKNPLNGKPMNGLVYQSIMGEYLIHPSECLENLIQPFTHIGLKEKIKVCSYFWNVF